MRENTGKIGLRFTTRPRPGVPVRDRGRKAPPFPKDQRKLFGVKSPLGMSFMWLKT